MLLDWKVFKQIDAAQIWRSQLCRDLDMITPPKQRRNRVYTMYSNIDTDHSDVGLDLT